jgi:hypothetical protein
MNKQIARSRLTTFSLLFSQLVVYWGLTVQPATAQSQVVACDLVDAQIASTMLKMPIKQHSPNRQIERVDGEARSICVFFTQRGSLRAHLYEFPTQAAAVKAFREEVAPGGQATYTPERGLGDEASSWSILTEAHGYVVRKGKRILVLDTRWHDALGSGEAKARLRPGMPSIVSKL